MMETEPINMNSKRVKLQMYLLSTPYIESNNMEIRKFARAVTEGSISDIDRAVRLYRAVRDWIRYSPYGISFEPDSFRASQVLKKGAGFCIQKAIVLAASARAIDIPSRLGFADVRNHLASQRLKDLMKTDIFFFHGYTELFLNEKWVKATPAFDRKFCTRFGVKPLEFDGKSDSVFQPFDHSGQRHMEYIARHGHFVDFPLALMERAFREGYPHIFGKRGGGWPKSGDSW
jgi:transglutaminase-like putative cysteine protease